MIKAIHRMYSAGKHTSITDNITSPRVIFANRGISAYGSLYGEKLGGNMGHNAHTIIVVTGLEEYTGTSISHVREVAIDIFNKHIDSVEDNKPNTGASMITPIFPSPMNGYRTFFIIPDGSKLGWDDSATANKARHEFTDWLTKQI